MIIKVSKGTVVTSTDEKGQHAVLSLRVTRDPWISLSRGSVTLFTPRGRDDVFVVVDRQGKLSVTDSSGQPASLRAATGSATSGAWTAHPCRRTSPTTEPDSDRAFGFTFTRGFQQRTNVRSTGVRWKPHPTEWRTRLPDLPRMKLDLTYDKNT